MIATIGRKSILRMLKSLQPQLTSNDYITVIYDGKDQDKTYSQVEIYLKTFQATTRLWKEEKNSGFWGHPILNKYKDLEGDFVLYADDDDQYAPDAFTKIRKHCVDPEYLYIFAIYNNQQHYCIFHPSAIAGGLISKQSGVIPIQYLKYGHWGLHYAGDLEFYNSLQRHIKKIKFINELIYFIR